MKDISKNLLPTEKILWSYVRKFSDAEKKSSKLVSSLFFLIISIIFGYNLYQVSGNLFEFLTGMVFVFIILGGVFFYSAYSKDKYPPQYFLTNLRIISITYENSGERSNVCMFKSFNYESIKQVNISKSVTNEEIINITLRGNPEVINGYQSFYEGKIPAWAENISNFNAGIVFEVTLEGKNIFLENIKKYQLQIKDLS